MILNIESFNRFPGQLREYVNSGVNGSLPLTQSADRETPSWPSGPTAMQSVTPVTPSTAAAVNVTNMKFAPRGLAGGGTSILNVTNVDTLINATEREGTQVKQPAVVVYEKVSFICNNLSQTNLLRKTEEMKEIIAECDNDFIHWLAQYLVMKRVTVEQNFQPLYNNFLISINDEHLDDYVKKETFRNVSILLRSDKRQAVSNFGDRQLLKNLGHWLGIITIGRDKPILAKDLDLKYLLLEAFYKGQQELLYIVPFVVKTLSASSKSTIFGPRCAWVYCIVKVLVEIHNEPDLKLNLKFEIEVLCKDLNIDLRSVEVGTYLKESSRLPKLIPIKPEGPSPIPRAQGASLLPPSNRSGDGTSQQQPERSTSTLPGQQQQQVQPPATFHYNDINIYIADGLSQHLKDPSHLALFQLHPQLKVLCKTAIVQAIKELIGGITERSINVAITATEHVVRKDFAMDPEEQHIRRAAHQMMRSMTAGMAAITCRDPLASTILGYLKQALHNHLGNNAAKNPEQAKMIDEAAFAVTEANLEVATNFIVKSACEKAVLELEKRLENEFSQRNRARKEAIRVKPGPIADDCLKIYDDFSSKICGFKPLSAQEIFAEFAHRVLVLFYGSFHPFRKWPAASQRTAHAFSRQTAAAVNSSSICSPNGRWWVRGLTAGGPDVDDQAALQNKVETILREWMTICYTPMAQRDPPHALSTIVKLMHQTGVLATDDMISKFFKLCADICFDVSYRLLKNEGTSQSTVVRRRCYYTLDAFVKLTCLMVKYSDGVHHSTKVNLLKKVLGILSSALHADHEARKADFNGMPFHRILILMFNELTSPDPVLDPISWHILEAFGQTLFVLQPRRLPVLPSTGWTS
uniref:CCR4-NOT transcription complex subunit 1 n=1 Tax=Ditylenchus dipsaci TaxID=166011 RepID=A0A915DXJ9_9BILA